MTVFQEGNSFARMLSNSSQLDHLLAQVSFRMASTTTI
jgi:hypothetical protein